MFDLTKMLELVAPHYEKVLEEHPIVDDAGPDDPSVLKYAIEREIPVSGQDDDGEYNWFARKDRNLGLLRIAAMALAAYAELESYDEEVENSDNFN